jgi:isopentenyldiphosphate isomerase
MAALMDVLDKDGNPTGQKMSKREIHENGMWHMASWVWIYNNKGQILLQLRSQNKDNHPGEWDISAAGHVEAGETPLEAAIREVHEEIGLSVTPDQLKLIDKETINNLNPVNKWKDREFSYVYIF